MPESGLVSVNNVIHEGKNEQTNVACEKLNVNYMKIFVFRFTRK